MDESAAQQTVEFTVRMIVPSVGYSIIFQVLLQPFRAARGIGQMVNDPRARDQVEIAPKMVAADLGVPEAHVVAVVILRQLPGDRKRMLAEVDTEEFRVRVLQGETDETVSRTASRVHHLAVFQGGEHQVEAHGHVVDGLGVGIRQRVREFLVQRAYIA
nr:hypothetical protein [Streptomyces sp. sk2.1]